MEKRTPPTQTNRSASNSRQRPRWSDSVSSTPSLASKIKHMVVISRGKMKLLNDTRQLQEDRHQDSVSRPKLLTVPLEIRLMIYDHIFTEHDTTYPNIHITYSSIIDASASQKAGPQHIYRITGHPCRDEEVQPESGRAWSGSAVQKARDPNLGVLPLILTCQALHDEVLDIFYAHKTWQFNDLYTIIFAVNHIPMKHFNNIRSLHLDAKALPALDTFASYITGLPDSYRQQFAHLAPPAKGLAARVLHRVDTEKVYIWQAVCHVIANMEALKRLRC